MVTCPSQLKAVVLATLTDGFVDKAREVARPQVRGGGTQRAKPHVLVVLRQAALLVAVVFRRAGAWVWGEDGEHMSRDDPERIRTHYQ